jgi:hypothetical protein
MGAQNQKPIGSNAKEKSIPESAATTSELQSDDQR